MMCFALLTASRIASLNTISTHAFMHCLLLHFEMILNKVYKIHCSESCLVTAEDRKENLKLFTYI
jgi:hypothetical protein